MVARITGMVRHRLLVDDRRRFMACRWLLYWEIGTRSDVRSVLRSDRLKAPAAPDEHVFEYAV